MLNLGCGQYLRNPFFSRILGSKVGVRVLYSCGLYSAVYGSSSHPGWIKHKTNCYDHGGSSRQPR